MRFCNHQTNTLHHLAATDQRWDGYFIHLFFPNNCTNSCHLGSCWWSWSPFQHGASLQLCPFNQQLFGPAHGGEEVGTADINSVDMCALHTYVEITSICNWLIVVNLCEFWLGCRGTDSYFTQLHTKQPFNVFFKILFVDIMSLSIKMKLP